MFIAFFLPWKLLFDVNAFHICDILLSNPNNISVDLISTGTHNDVFNIQPNTFLHKRIKIGKLWLLCKKPFLSQIDTHTRLFSYSKGKHAIKRICGGGQILSGEGGGYEEEKSFSCPHGRWYWLCILLRSVWK